MAFGIGAAPRNVVVGGQRRPTRRWSRLGLVGLVLIGVALVQAVVGTLASPGLAAGHLSGHEAHLLAFVGMVLVIVGVLGGSMPPALDDPVHREDSHAVR